jgi:hypothetical protein
MPRESAITWLARIKAVEREYALAQLAIDRFRQHTVVDPSLLAENQRIRDIDIVLQRLEGTYLVRLFSEFETALRHYLIAKKFRKPTQTRALIDAVRSRVDIPEKLTEPVHKVRHYRNSLVHDVEETVDPVTLREATKNCSTFLSWLQRTW